MDVLAQYPNAFLGSRLKRLAEEMLADASALARQNGVSVPSGLYPVLFLLAGSDGRTVGDLALAMKVSQPAMTKSVAKLVKAGLVQISKGASDKRQSIVIMTTAGRTAVARGQEAILPLIDNVVRELTAGLSGDFSRQIDTIERRLSDRSLSNRAEDHNMLEIEQARDEDLPHVVTLLNQAYRDNSSQSAWTTEVGLIDGDRISEETLGQDVADKPDARLMVYKPEGKVKGCVWLEPSGNDVWYLGSLAVDPGMQNAGLGRRLMAAAEAYIRLHGGRQVKMTVIDVRDALLAWYERRGYQRTGITEPFPYGDTRFGTPTRPGLQFEVLTKAL